MFVVSRVPYKHTHTHTLTGMSIVLSAAEISQFPVDRGICHKSGKHSLIVFKSSGGELKVTANSCLHLGQRFVTDIEDAALMKCETHNARLDPKTMMYTQGPTWMSGMGNKVVVGSVQVRKMYKMGHIR